MALELRGDGDMHDSTYAKTLYGYCSALWSRHEGRRLFTVLYGEKQQPEAQR